MAPLVVSPHLDDGVFSCGELIAAHPGTRLVTVFAGWPDATGLTDWDRDCGFAERDDVVGARRAEDVAACAALGATPVWLDFLDGQYGESPALDAVEATLRELVTDAAPDALYVPLGLIHPDHERAHLASRRLVGTVGCRVIAYEDAPYRARRSAVDRRITELRAAGFTCRPLADTEGRDEQRGERKRAAIAEYRSQLLALERHWPGFQAALRDEAYWELSR